MNSSIIPQLVRKDFLMLRRMVLAFSLVSFSSFIILLFLFGKIPNWVLMNITFFMLLGPTVACGIVVLMKTNVLEKEKSTQLFIMSLPVTAREFTIAKLLVNIYIFGWLWLVVVGASFYFSFGLGILTLGALPFFVITFLGIFIAYICVLSVSLIFQSLAATITSIVVSELITCVYLWLIVFIDPVSNYIYGSKVVWNTATVSIIIGQVFFALSSIVIAFFLQSRKRDFV